MLRRQPNRRAFTLAEIMVASVITSIALLGIYAMFHRLVTLDAKAGVEWNDRRAAGTVVDHLGDCLGEIVNVSGAVPIVTQSDESGSSVICRTALGAARYQWVKDETNGGYLLQRQVMVLAADRNLSLPEVPDDYHKPEAWKNIPPSVIATRLSQISVQADRVKETSADGQEQPSSPDTGSNWRVTVVAAVGNQVCHRTFITQAKGDLLK